MAKRGAKKRRANKGDTIRRLNVILKSQEINYLEMKDTKGLWDEFRTGKMYPCSGEDLDRLASFLLNQELVANVECKEDQPRNGSPFWVETIDPPKWFEERELRGR